MISAINIPPRNDVRWLILLLLAIYIIMGTTLLGFNRAPSQIAIIIFSACILDTLLHYLFKKKWIFPLSAAITGCGLSILINVSHGIFLPLIPVFFAISSKHIFTAQGQHVFNPALFGVVASLLVGGDMITPSPSYQWGGGELTIVIFIVTAAILLFVRKINRSTLIISFLIFYLAQLCLRALLTPDLMPAHMLFLGAFANPAFYLFTFFMITDPKTSPEGKWGQIFMAFAIVLIDLALHMKQSYATLFFAGFSYFFLRWIYLHAAHAYNGRYDVKKTIITSTRKIIYISCIGLGGFYLCTTFINTPQHQSAGFKLTKIDADSAGISTHKSDILAKVDTRIAHIAKWILSVGDAVAVADANNDGLQDIFLTYTLKDKTDRAALYLNKGNFEFQRFPLPSLTNHYADYTKNGLPSGALWFDNDNDGDKDLLVLTGYGKAVFLKNLLTETGALSFEDITDTVGLNHHLISLTANVFDADNNGTLDLLIGNALPTMLKDYTSPTPLNIFNLPKAEFAGDRRMFNFMHRTWHNANNGGHNYFYKNNGTSFNEISPKISSLTNTRWTLDIGTADFNNDGNTDLYLANDFGPDELFINNGAGNFKREQGYLAHHIGKDVYKSMNSSVADFDNNGYPDIYTSNVHHKLQAEGSQLWFNDGSVDKTGYKAFTDVAYYKNALNENRFGWGAAIGDLNLDGKPDIIQANGMVGNSYDTLYDDCPDYWYWNEKIALTSPDGHGYADNWADLRGRCIFPDEQDRIYLNTGKYFIDVANSAGLINRGNSRGVALADLDNDGDLDILISDQFEKIGIYKNELSHKNRWVGITLIGNGTSCNKDAIGTRVTIDGKKHSIKASNGFSSQNDARILAGVTNQNATTIAVKIQWCGNTSEVTHVLPTNTYSVIKQ